MGRRPTAAGATCTLATYTQHHRKGSRQHATVSDARTKLNRLYPSPRLWRRTSRALSVLLARKRRRIKWCVSAKVGGELGGAELRYKLRGVVVGRVEDNEFDYAEVRGFRQCPKSQEF